MSDLIDRQAAIDAADKIIERDTSGNNDVVKAMTAWKMYVEGLPSAQPEQNNASEFWRKRAEFYSDMCMNLIGEMGKGVKVESVQISENGIAFIKEQPSAQPEETCDTCKHGYFGGRQCDNCRVGYPSHYERRTDET